MTGPKPGEPVGLHEDRQRAESFGREAERYERTRPGYPDELITMLGADDPATVLDVGCGTGKAGRLLVDRGCHVVGVEPDALMAQIARRFGLQVEVATFEEWQPHRQSFDLVISAQAWHWVDPTRGPIKARSVLNASGRLAAFWNIYVHEPEMRAALDAVYTRVLPESEGADCLALGRDSDPEGRAHMAAIEATSLFGAPEHDQYESARRYTTDEWLDGLPTFSDHARLPTERLDALLDGVRAVIDQRGGVIALRYVTHVVTARPRGRFVAPSL
jgi:SAM-dependent methyltransferase